MHHREEELAHEEAERIYREEQDREHEAREMEDFYRKQHEEHGEALEVLPYHEDSPYYHESGYSDYDRARHFDEDFETHRGDESHHTFDDREDERLFSIDHYNEADGEHADVDIHDLDERKREHSSAHYLSAATSVYLDTTVTKFLQNDISVTKFLETANDITVTKFLDTTVTKFLEDNDISVTKFLA